MMIKIVPSFPENAWVRTCQECDHRQRDVRPEYGKALTSAYEQRKCKRCKSEALDYGKLNASYSDDDEMELVKSIQAMFGPQFGADDNE